MGDFVVWIGGLPKGVKESEVERFLKGYGRITDIQVRSSARDVFCFVTFDNARDGEDAIADLDQREFLRSDHIVQLAQANRGAKGGGKGKRKGSRSRSRGRPPPRRGDSRDRRRSGSDEFIVWMGGLPRGVQEDELRSFLKGYGQILDIRIRSSAKDVFAFASFADSMAGRDAVRDLDQRRFPHTDNIVQICESTTPRPSKDFEKHYDIERRKAGHGRASGYRVKIQHLPDDMDWAELKDIARTFGDSVKYTSVFVDSGINSGVVEFMVREDAEYALKQLDNRRMDGHSRKLKAFKDNEHIW